MVDEPEDTPFCPGFEAAEQAEDHPTSDTYCKCGEPKHLHKSADIPPEATVITESGKKVFAFAFLPLNILNRRDVTPRQKLAAMAMIYIDARKDIKGDAVAAVSELTGMSYQHSQDALRCLELNGLLVRKTAEQRAAEEAARQAS